MLILQDREQSPYNSVVVKSLLEGKSRGDFLGFPSKTALHIQSPHIFWAAQFCGYAFQCDEICICLTLSEWWNKFEIFTNLKTLICTNLMRALRGSSSKGGKRRS